MDFLEEVENFNDEALYSDFTYAIDYKWEKDKKYVMIIAYVYLVYVLLLDIYVFIRHDSDEQLAGLKISILIITLLLWTFEMIQAYFEGYVNYITNVENYFDLSGLFFVDVLVILELS